MVGGPGGPGNFGSLLDSARFDPWETRAFRHLRLATLNLLPLPRLIGEGVLAYVTAEELNADGPWRYCDGTQWLPLVTGGGLPIFYFDYLVDKRYTGTEGAVFAVASSAHTFKRYTTIKGAVDDANANRQANGQSSSFLIQGGGVLGNRYQEATQINLDPPAAGSYHLFGTGADTTQIEGTMTSGALFNIPTQSGDSLVEFHHIEVRTLEAIALIQGGGSTRVALDNCWLRPNNSGARAIDAGSGAVGWNVANTNFEGAGIGIDSGTLMNVRLTNCYMAMTVGIRMVNATQVYCTNVKFNCSSRDVEIGATTGALFFSAVNCEFNKGIYFTSGINFSFFDNFVVGSCTFLLGSGEVGIDYSGATREGALLAAAAHSITGNTFRGSGTAKGIVGGSALADGPHCVTFVGNTFEGFAADNEIVDMDLTGDNEVAHNCTDSGATLYDSHSLLSHDHSDGDEGGTVSIIQDDDTDTSWDTEESPDEDILRAKVAGTPRVAIYNTGDILRLLGVTASQGLVLGTANDLAALTIRATDTPNVFAAHAIYETLNGGHRFRFNTGLSAELDFVSGAFGAAFIIFGGMDSSTSILGGPLDALSTKTGIIISANGAAILRSDAELNGANPRNLSVTWLPFVDATYDFGSSALRWKDGYFSGTIKSGSATPTSIQVGGSIVSGADQVAQESASLDLVATDRALILNRLTTTQRNALTALDGMALYNTTVQKFQSRENGAWVDLVHAKYTDAEARTAVPSLSYIPLGNAVDGAPVTP